MNIVEIRVRPATLDDAAAVRSLVRVAMGAMPYASVFASTVDAALSDSDEARALVAASVASLVGVAIYGEVAGARGAARLHLVAVSAAAQRRGVGERLVNAALAELGAHGARFVAAELPDDPTLAGARALLARCGFEEEARLPDFYRDGVALTYLRKALTGLSAPSAQMGA